MPPLESGTYVPADTSEEVTVWPTVKDDNGNETPDYDNIPEGFIDEEDATGKDYFVLTDGTKRNRPIRDPAGNAIVLLPGGAAVKRSNGTVYTLTPDELEAYAYEHTLESSPAPAPDPSPAPQPDPQPAPQPAPTPQPDPQPQPSPQPVNPPPPVPDPQPQPQPDPQPSPSPADSGIPDSPATGQPGSQTVGG